MCSKGREVLIVFFDCVEVLPDECACLIQTINHHLFYTSLAISLISAVVNCCKIWSVTSGRLMVVMKDYSLYTTCCVWTVILLFLIF